MALPFFPLAAVAGMLVCAVKGILEDNPHLEKAIKDKVNNFKEGVLVTGRNIQQKVRDKTHPVRYAKPKSPKITKQGSSSSTSRPKGTYPGHSYQRNQKSVAPETTSQYKQRTREESLRRSPASSATTIFIDGSNMMYDDRKFIGLAALVPVSDALLARGFEVFIMFDSSASRLLGASRSEIQSYFSSGVDVCFAVDGEADVFLLNTAINTCNSVIISNDKYRDYPDRMSRLSDMVLGFAIMRNTLTIPKLNLYVTI